MASVSPVGAHKGMPSNHQGASPRAMERTTPRRLAVNYYPSPAQLAFHQDRGKVQERALLAGTGGGKTYSAAYECFEITLKEAPSVVVAAAPDYPQLEQSIYATLRRLFGVNDLHAMEPWAKFNESKKTLNWWNGWEWRFASMDDPTSVEGIPESSVVWLTEGRLVRYFDGPDGAWLNLTRRLRGQASRPRHAIMDTHSATNGIMETFKPRHVDRIAAPGVIDAPGYEVGHFEVTDCEDPQRRIYQWGTRDAIAWGTLDLAAGERILRAYSGSAAQSILEGRCAKPEGRVYQDFQDARHLKPLPAGVKPEYYTGGIDWGWHVTAITVHAWTGSRRWTVAERRLENAGLPRIAQTLAELHNTFRSDWTWYSGHDRPDSAHDLSQLTIAGRRLRVTPVKPGRVMDGVGRLQGLLQADEWFVAPECKDIRLDLDNYIMDKARGEPDKGAYDAHFLDSCRYGLCGAEPPRFAETYD